MFSLLITSMTGLGKIPWSLSVKVGDLVLYKKEYAGMCASPGIVIEVPTGRTYVIVAFDDNVAPYHQSILEIVDESR